MISLQVELTAYEDDIQEWCLTNGYDYDNDNLEDYVEYFVEWQFGISPDSVRIL